MQRHDDRQPSGRKDRLGAQVMVWTFGSTPNQDDVVRALYIELATLTPSSLYSRYLATALRQLARSKPQVAAGPCEVLGRSGVDGTTAAESAIETLANAARLPGLEHEFE